MTITAIWTSPAAGGTLDLGAGGLVTETIWDALVSDLNVVGGTSGSIAAAVTKSAVQSIANAANTVLTFDTESFDTGGLHDPVTNNSKFTIQVAGVYLVLGLVEYAANATGIRRAVISKNSGAVRTVQATNQGAGDGTQVLVYEVSNCIVSDIFELLAHQTSGGALNVTITNTFFAIGRL